MLSFYWTSSNLTASRIYFLPPAFSLSLLKDNFGHLDITPPHHSTHVALVVLELTT